jgi:hypothetical protein
VHNTTPGFFPLRWGSRTLFAQIVKKQPEILHIFDSQVGKITVWATGPQLNSDYFFLFSQKLQEIIRFFFM